MAFAKPFYSLCLVPVRRTNSCCFWEHAQVTMWFVGVQIPKLGDTSRMAQMRQSELSPKAGAENGGDAPHPAQGKTAHREPKRDRGTADSKPVMGAIKYVKYI